jgi:hypothetical protein
LAVGVESDNDRPIAIKAMHHHFTGFKKGGILQWFVSFA